MKKKRTLLILVAVVLISTFACDTGIRNPFLYYIAQRGYLIRSREESPIVSESPIQPTPIATPNETPETKLPALPLTYQGDIEGLTASITIDFSSTLLTGTLVLSGDDYARADIQGRFNHQGFTFTAVFSGVVGSVAKSMELPWYGTLTGAVSSDFNTLSGTLVDDEGTSVEFSLSP